MEIENSDGSIERQRDRSRRSERGSRFTDADADDKVRDRSRDGREKSTTKRVCVSNIPYSYRWQELKDLFRRMVGSVEFVEINNDENNRSRGEFFFCFYLILFLQIWKSGGFLNR